MERKSKGTLSSIVLAISLLCIVFLAISAYNPLDPGVEFDDLVCNQIISDSTIGASSSFDGTNFSACLDSLEDYSSGDKLYKFVVDDTATFAIDFFTLDTSTLDVFILSNQADTLCPDTCVAAIIGGGSEELSLMPGIYWIIVDGKAVEGVLEEGAYQLSVQCEKEYTLIECGQVIEHDLNNRVNNYGILDYGACFETADNLYDSGDRLYKIEITEPKTVDFVLDKAGSSDIHFFLLDDAIDITDGSVCPGSCLGKSDTGSVKEQLTAILPIGIYFIVVDAPEPIDGETNYNLSIFCTKDFDSMECLDKVSASTSGRVSYYDNSDYCSTEFNHAGGDITYMFELLTDDTIALEMVPEDGINLNIFLFSSDTVDTAICPDSCIGVSDTSAGMEIISAMLPAGNYFVVVDGATDGEGAFSLELVCRSLPIELVKFDGKPVQNGIQISWETATEINFEGFYLQRSDNSTNWIDLDWIQSKGSSSTPASYNYLDPKPHNGLNFFRLKSMDLDGTADLSNIIQINFARSFESVMVYPTTTTDRVTISGMDAKVEIFYEIYSSLGQQLGKGTISNKNKTLDVSRFGPGLLYLTLNDGSQVKTFPIQKI